MLLGVFIVFVKASFRFLSLHIPDESYYRPPLSPPKNPIKREKKKLVYSSEREDFIKSGEDWFVRFLRVLLNVLLRYSKTLSIVFCVLANSLSSKKSNCLSPFIGH